MRDWDPHTAKYLWQFLGIASKSLSVLPLGDPRPCVLVVNWVTYNCLVQECGRSDVLRPPRKCHKCPCSFCLVLLTHLPRGRQLPLRTLVLWHYQLEKPCVGVLGVLYDCPNWAPANSQHELPSVASWSSSSAESLDDSNPSQHGSSIAEETPKWSVQPKLFPNS